MTDESGKRGCLRTGCIGCGVVAGAGMLIVLVIAILGIVASSREERIEPVDVAQALEARAASMALLYSKGISTRLANDPINAPIKYDDFAKLDLRIARIIKAEPVEGADKLLQLTLDIGGNTRNVFAGIKAAYAPETLEGKLTVMVANLEPRKMRFGVSEGMVLAAGPGGGDLWLIHPDSGAEPGMRVK